MENFTTFWCFRLAALTRKVSRAYNSLCARHGVTASQSFVLFDLLDHEGSSVKDIAARIQLDSPAVTGLIDRLHKEGLLQRAEDPNDRRSLQIFLTPKGRALAEAMLPMGREFHLAMKQSLSPDLAERFEQALAALESAY
ncbi:MAG: MarR family transcriptional regulator [Syntrophomonadaceae bacterium]|nr:MarR family transcriptional regulator [Syntrophomonadaceae bacterium]MDH7497123.1 MarR family transcriptional regulator [Syntrophomonadaceae bacterium]